jgi:DNA-3-methyladenine glycosylase I
MSKQRCEWCLGEPTYVAYHDEEWGVPVYEDQLLFEQFILETMQAGLSWITILKKRKRYREVTHQFNPAYMASLNDTDLQSLMSDSGIIRNRLKIASLKKNALAYLEIKKEQSFADFLWSYVDHKTIKNDHYSLSDLPVQTPISVALSKELKKRGFTFVGPTVVYAFMQAVGMVNDHVVNCHRYEEV